MATRRQIKIQFEQTARKAGELQSCAEELARIAKRLESIQTQLDGCWKGESASLYRTKCGQLKDKVNRSASNLSRTSSTISKSARLYRDAELRALELAQTRSV